MFAEKRLTMRGLVVHHVFVGKIESEREFIIVGQKRRRDAFFLIILKLKKKLDYKTLIFIFEKSKSFVVTLF